MGPWIREATRNRNRWRMDECADQRGAWDQVKNIFLKKKNTWKCRNNNFMAIYQKYLDYISIYIFLIVERYT